MFVGPAQHRLHPSRQAGRRAGSEAVNEQALLSAARSGDEDAFARLVAPYRAQLAAHCYRMLGSLQDAEDALQETLLRAWRGLSSFHGRSSLRSWLYAIATNASLRMIERRPKRVLPIDYGPPSDPHGPRAQPVTEAVWVEPFPDSELGLESPTLGPEARYEQRESVELAFTAALQGLPARQRAALILRDVLGFSARETAEALETTPVSIDSALQRAHKTMEARKPARSQQATLRPLGDKGLQTLVTRFADAWEQHDVAKLVALLVDDARMTMPPEPGWYQGREAVAAFLGRFPLAEDRRFHLVPTSANAQPALAAYVWSEQAAAFEAESIIVLTLRGEQIEEITAFRSPGLFPRFNLDSRLSTAVSKEPS
jgi:RNA polymerase sigma-70 factor, ECF subfamily